MLMRVSRIWNVQVEEVCWADLERRSLTRAAAGRYVTEASRASFVQRVNGHLPEIVSAWLGIAAGIDAVTTSLVAKGEAGQPRCQWREEAEYEGGSDLWTSSDVDLADFRVHDLIQRFADECKCIQEAVWTALDEDDLDIVSWSGGDWTISWDGGPSSSVDGSIDVVVPPSVSGRRRLHLLITIVAPAEPDLTPESRALIELQDAIAMREDFERIVLPRAERRFGRDVLKWHRPAWIWDIDYSSRPGTPPCPRVIANLRGLPEPTQQDGEWVFSRLGAVFQ